MQAFVVSLFAGAMATWAPRACELCAIYNSTDARGEFKSGFMLALEEQYVAYGTPQLNGEPIRSRYPNALDSSITHLLPSYNFSPRLGISLNIPVIYNSFERTDLHYFASGPLPILGAKLETEKGHETGIGDLALIGRWSVVDKQGMKYGVVLNLLGGLKLPTGDTSRLREEVEQDRFYQKYFVVPGAPHDPLSHSISSIHLHDLALGSGSVDGVLGATLTTRWDRWLVTAQFQYYLRMEGEDSFRYGDDLIATAGPGAYLLLDDRYTVSLRLIATYETMGEDEILGQKSALSGETAWYLGPQAVLTWGTQWSANLGVDLPVRVANRGLQNAADYRLKAGVNWRF
jgi:hypothetical protein